jgi:hypothetical protein
MKAVAAVLVTLLLSAGAAEAAWYPRKKLPRPIDSPVVRPKLKETHKQGNKAKHPPSHVRLTTPADTARA